jgi:phenylacetate-CoA ligase
MQDLSPRPGDLEPIETAPADELRQLQTERLHWSVRHAYDNVPFYRSSFDAAGVHPDDVRSLADLALVPFTTKADLRDNYPFGMFAVPRERVARIHASSRGASAPPAAERGTCSTTPTATACSPEGWAPTPAPRSWAAP